MSYCRFIDGDVYMYPDVRGGIRCCACRLNEPAPGGIFGRSERFDTAREALDHLFKHRDAGHHVPQCAINQLLDEINE